MRKGYLFISAIIIILICFSCNEKKYTRTIQNNSEDPQDKNNEPSQADIYCWCFESDSSETISRCSTPYALHPDEIINKSTLLRSYKNADTLLLLKKLLFQKKHSTKDFTGWVFESRFLFLFKNSSFSDTVVYYTDTSFIHNNMLYIYPFNIMDSIKSLLDLKEISCMNSEPTIRQ